MIFISYAILDLFEHRHYSRDSQRFEEQNAVGEIVYVVTELMMTSGSLRPNKGLALRSDDLQNAVKVVLIHYIHPWSILPS